MKTAAVFGACLRRDYKIARSYRLAFTLQAVAVLAGLAVFSGVGQLVEGGRIARETGVQGGYFAFVSVGIAVTGVLNILCTAFARRVREDQTTGAFEAMLLSPTDPKLLVVAGAAYEVVRGLALAVTTVLFAVVVFGVDLHLHARTIPALLVAFPALLVVLASVGVVIAAVGVVFKDPGPIVALATAGVALISGAYFPISVLPDPLPDIAKAVPFTWGLDTLRGGLLGAHVAVWKCVALVGIAAAVFPFALALYERALDVARRRGSLGLY
jgi:ABC-2 type transport system permease protein